MIGSRLRNSSRTLSEQLANKVYSSSPLLLRPAFFFFDFAGEGFCGSGAGASSPLALRPAFLVCFSGDFGFSAAAGAAATCLNQFQKFVLALEGVLTSLLTLVLGRRGLLLFFF